MNSLHSKRNQLPGHLSRFFWEYDSESLDIDTHANLIMMRIMERGSWQAMEWLRNTYRSKMIADLLLDKGWRMLPSREVNYWALISGMAEETRKRLVKKASLRDTIWSQRSAYRCSE